MMRRVLIVLITALASCLWLGVAGSQWGGHTQKRVSPPSQREYPQYPKKTQKQGKYFPPQRETPKATSSTPKITKKEFSQNYKYTRTPKGPGNIPKGWEGTELLQGSPWLGAFPNYFHIPVRVTATDKYYELQREMSNEWFTEFQGSAVAKGWLMIDKNLKDFILHAETITPERRSFADQVRSGHIRYREPEYPIPIDPSIKITKLNGWWIRKISPSPGIYKKTKYQMKFDRTKLNRLFSVLINYPPVDSNLKTNITLLFPRYFAISPPEDEMSYVTNKTNVGPDGIVGDARLQTPFIVTPAMMKKYVDQGYFTKTFSLQERKDGYYEESENITIKIEFLGKMGKPKVIAMPTPVPKKKEKEEEEKWEVFLTGYEIDEMNPYWKITTRVRGAVRFDWKLRGKFTIVNKKGVRTYAGGVITIADVGLSSLYEPISVWLTKPFKCRGCQDVKSLTGKYLRGIVAGNEVRFYWGSKRPYVNVEAKIVVPCKPKPDCARWKERRFDSEEFLSRVNYVSIPLVDGATVHRKVKSPRSQARWINYRYLLRRLK